jgi:molybdenum cofactor cytidylyltransferase
MGQPKLALPLGERTILEHVIAALRQAEIEHILVVIGPHVPELAVLAKSAGAEVCSFAEPTRGMRETVEHGLRCIEERFHPRHDDSWLLAPPDHPALDASVVTRLASAYAAEPEFSILIPTYLGRRGHPTLFAWKHVPAIQAFCVEHGLNTFVRQRVTETLEVAVDSPTVLWDMDTPEDYEWLRQNWPMSSLLPRESNAGSAINSQ